MKLLSAIDFHNKWLEKNEENFIYFDKQDLLNLKLKKNDEDFLCTSGIPEWAAPNMFFFNQSSIDLIDECYFFFGEDSQDRKVCIDTKNENIIVILENNCASHFVNSSLQAFFTSIYEYMLMVDEALSLNGESAFINNNIPSKVIENFSTRVARFDALAVANKSFWEEEIFRLKSHII